jgi:hypothetical protein
MTAALELITESALIAEIRRRAAAEPDRVYRERGNGRQCQYLPGEGNPSCGCLVGEALAALDVPHEALLRLDGQDPDYPPTYGYGTVSWGGVAVHRILDGHLTLKAICSPWVRRVQQNQDFGMRWSEAAAEADLVGQEQGWVLT